MSSGENLLDMSTIISNLLTLTEQSTLHMALQDRESHLKSDFMPGDPHIAELLRHCQALHYRLFTCTCNPDITTMAGIEPEFNGSVAARKAGKPDIETGAVHAASEYVQTPE